MGYTIGIAWNENLIKQEIFKVMESLTIKRMPTVSEITMVTGNHKLANAITRYGGYKEWANKLDLYIKKSETKLGVHGEKIIEDLLIKNGYEVKKMSVKHPYDLLVNGSIKIDVKTSKRYYYSKENYSYSFNLEKKFATCDIYTCICIDINNNIEKILVIPSTALKQTQLCIGMQSKYDKYIDSWNYLKMFDNFYKNLVI